jgi:hypothetical protein
MALFALEKEKEKENGKDKEPFAVFVHATVSEKHALKADGLREACNALPAQARKEAAQDRHAATHTVQAIDPPDPEFQKWGQFVIGIADEVVAASSRRRTWSVAVR